MGDVLYNRFQQFFLKFKGYVILQKDFNAHKSHAYGIINEKSRFDVLISVSWSFIKEKHFLKLRAMRPISATKGIFFFPPPKFWTVFYCYCK